MERLENIEEKLRMLEQKALEFGHSARVDAQVECHSDVPISSEINQGPFDAPAQQSANADDGQLVSEDGNYRYVNHSFWVTLDHEVWISCRYLADDSVYNP